MMTRLLQDARYWPRRWARRWRNQIAVLELGALREHLASMAMIGAPVLLVGTIVYFAYSNRTPYSPVSVESAHRRAIEAQRRSDDLRCLAENVYFEARGEPLDGQFAVAEVTLNRVRSKHFPHSICGVVHETHFDPIRKRYVAQYSWTELGPLSPQDTEAWTQAMSVATTAYDQMHEHVVPGALFYHATGISPSWAKTKTTVGTIGNHVFYR